MPETPRIGECIDFSLLYLGSKKELIQGFENNTFVVQSITWAKDKDGHIAMLFCDIVLENIQGAHPEPCIERCRVFYCVSGKRLTLTSL